MSVGEEQTECPLCMEPLEMDDINFFPCTCGYQICRFCWHRIRTDENGLCPACRKQYPEDPAEFKPLTDDELQRIKKERRQKDLQRKQKAAENRKHLANVRVVQRNLVFVVGLSQRLADPEVLKKAEYFGKFGKIHKVVINHSTSYAGAQVRSNGPSASAYVTYQKPEDALKAIQAVNNIYIDGRSLKSSLGTTKYCSHFLRGSQCPKGDCMYLHELGEEAASFTKEEMQQGKHQEYEQKLYEQFMNSQNLANQISQPTTSTTETTTTTTTTKNSGSKQTRKKNNSPQTIQGGVSSSTQPKEAWPSLQPGASTPTSGSPNTTGGGQRLTNGNKAAPPAPSERGSASNSPPPANGGVNNSATHKQDTQNAQNRAPGHHRNKSTDHEHSHHSKSKGSSQSNNSSNDRGSTHPPSLLQTDTSPQISPRQQTSAHSHTHNTTQPPSQQSQQQVAAAAAKQQRYNNTYSNDSGTSPPITHAPLASSGAAPVPLMSQQIAPPPGHPAAQPSQPQQPPQPMGLPNSRMSPFSSTVDSMSLFGNSGFGNRNPNPPQHVQPEGIATTEIPDTLPVSSNTDWQAAFGFTPSSLGETQDDDLGFDPWNESSKGLADLIEKEGGTNYHHNTFSSGPNHMSNVKSLPPGFTPNHIGAYNGNLNAMGYPSSKMMGLMQIPPVLPPHMPPNSYHDVLSDMPLQNKEPQPLQHHTQRQILNHSTPQVKDWQEGLRALLPNINISFGPQMGQSANASTQTSHNSRTNGWPAKNSAPDLAWDPAIVTSGHITDQTEDQPPHWMASLQNLTDDTSNHRLPFLQQLPLRTPPTWGGQSAAHPPPGFHPVGPIPTQEPHKLAAARDGLQ